jgi:hypothetical protein
LNFDVSFNLLSVAVFLLLFFLLLSVILLYSRSKQIHSIFFWIVSILGAVIVSYIVSLLI